MTSVKTDIQPLIGTEPWVGVNFWSSAGGPRMWARYDGDVVRAELAALAQLGLNVTRSFCYWPDFVPTPEALDEEVMERFVDFLDLHVEQGLSTIPTFIVGHMSGENWDPAWRGGRDLYRDVWLVAQQAWFVAEVARRTAGHPAITGWLLTNEMPLYGGLGDTEVVTSWARLLVQALRSAGANQPVGTGDGAWGIEVSGNDNGFSLRRLAPLVDIVGPHVYPSADDPVRQMLTAAFACELCASFDKPVILEEFGLSSDMASGRNAAHYYRQVLHSTLLAGARGWLAWNNCDYDNLAAQAPYSHHPFEMHFGITDHAGRPKPQALEMARFAQLVSRLSKGGWHRVGGEVAIVVPEHFEHTETSWSKIHRGDMRDNLFQSYIAAREADLPVALVRERDLAQRRRDDQEAEEVAEAGTAQGGTAQGGPAESGPGLGGPAPKLYLMPCAKLVTAPGLQTMLGLARAGATVYASYFAGSGKDQLGPWMPWLNQVFGVEQQLRYGMTDTIEDDVVTLEMVQDLGPLGEGTRLSFAVAGTRPTRSHLPIEPAGAEILAVDELDRPALVRNRAGDGWMVLCTYPLEHMAARQPDANPTSIWRLYSALAEAAGVSRPVRVDDPRICIGALRVGGTDTFMAINLCDETVAAPLVAPGLSVRVVPSPAATADPTGGDNQTDGGPAGKSQGPVGTGPADSPTPARADDAPEPSATSPTAGASAAPSDGAREGEIEAVDENMPPGLAATDGAGLIVHEHGTELLELGPYEVAMLEAVPLPPQGPTEGQDVPGSAGGGPPEGTSA